ncbi:hypothetical protein BJY52DRAFT_1196186 [Lactarius psammicola]|nr:hypothetical protein BJY52DRAFT_1196186 [Lactarius psammicola]
MGFDAATFRLLLVGPGRFGERWESTPIPRNDVSIIGVPRLARCSLNGAGALGLILHYLGSAMLEVMLQQIFTLTPSVLSRYLEAAESTLYDILLQIHEAWISMPRNKAELKRLSSLIWQRHPLLEGAFGPKMAFALHASIHNPDSKPNIQWPGQS